MYIYGPLILYYLLPIAYCLAGLEEQKGLFAADSLKRGQIIFEEDPLISVPSGSSCEAQVLLSTTRQSIGKQYHWP